MRVGVNGDGALSSAQLIRTGVVVERKGSTSPLQLYFWVPQTLSQPLLHGVSSSVPAQAGHWQCDCIYCKMRTL